MQRNRNHKQEEQQQGVQPIGNVLRELLAQYGRRFPHLQLTTVVVPLATDADRAASMLHP